MVRRHVGLAFDGVEPCPGLFGSLGGRIFFDQDLDNTSVPSRNTFVFRSIRPWRNRGWPFLREFVSAPWPRALFGAQLAAELGQGLIGDFARFDQRRGIVVLFPGIRAFWLAVPEMWAAFWCSLLGYSLRS